MRPVGGRYMVGCHAELLAACRFTANQFNGRTRYAQCLRQPGLQGEVSFAVYRWRLQSNTQGIVMQALNLGLWCIGHDVNIHDDSTILFGS